MIAKPVKLAGIIISCAVAVMTVRNMIRTSLPAIAGRMGEKREWSDNVICPECGSQNVFIKDTKGNDSKVVQRRRFCENCKLSFWTHEEPYADLRKPKKTNI